MPLIDRIYMGEALKEARKALEAGEVPVGAVVVHRRQLIGRAHHQTHALNDPTAHAPMIAITQAANALGSRWLKSATLYATVKPCPMCAGALTLAGVERVVYGAPARASRRRRAVALRGRVLPSECTALLVAYQRRRRQRQQLTMERCRSG